MMNDTTKECSSLYFACQHAQAPATRSTPEDVAKNNIFFFQAEDGIRDHCVTGVKTCALPILGRRSACTVAASSLRPSRFRSFTSASRSEEHTSELQSHSELVCRLLLEKK